MKLALGAIALAVMAQAQENSVRVYATPNNRGDVSFRFLSDHGAEERLSSPLSEILRDTIGCDASSGTGSGRGVITCRFLLRSDHGVVDQELQLAPLARTLHDSGIARVTVFGPGDAEDGIWRQSSAAGTLMFESDSAAELPPPLHVRVGHRIDPADLVPPLIVVVFIPALVAMWVEMNGPGGAMWLSWLSLGSWFYWISAIDTSNIASYFGGMLQVNLWIGLVFGALLYAMPPLISVTGCIIALAPRLLPGQNSWDDLAKYLKRSLAGSAAWTLALGIFLVGSAMFEYDWKIGAGSWLLAYAIYKLIGAWAAHGNDTEMRALDSGDLLTRAHELARRAGVQIKRVYLVRNRLPREANAFAFGNGQIGLTEGLLQGLTRREVDAVMAHEIGHLKGAHVGVQGSMVWIYYLLAAPLIGYVMTRAGLPEWIRMLPLAPILATFCMAYLSQRHEFSADARAAELTDDAEGKIAALARLAKLTRSPLDWGGFQGSIITHPSMKKRVLAIARHCGLAEDRAVKLLRDPDLLESARRYYELPSELRRDPVFNTAAKMRFLKGNIWRWEIAVVGLLFALAYAVTFASSSNGNPGWKFLAFLAGLPMVLWATEYMGVAARRRFLHRMEPQLRERLNPGDAIFMGLMPGAEIQRVEAFPEWDLGFVTLGPDALTYRGERAQFALPRTSICAIEIAGERFRWKRVRRVRVRWSGEAFSLQLPGAGSSRRQAKQLLNQFVSWRGGLRITGHDNATTLPAPLLPAVPGDYIGKARLCWIVVKKAGKLLIGSTLLMTFLPLSGPVVALVPFAAAFMVGLDVLPAFFARGPSDPTSSEAELRQPIIVPSGRRK